MKEWLWMDYPNEQEDNSKEKSQPQRGQLNENVEKIKDSEWDYYSGLPNPTWYENNQ